MRIKLVIAHVSIVLSVASLLLAQCLVLLNEAGQRNEGNELRVLRRIARDEQGLLMDYDRAVREIPAVTAFDARKQARIKNLADSIFARNFALGSTLFSLFSGALVYVCMKKQKEKLGQESEEQRKEDQSAESGES